jgi:bifunctional enzyme CysN/CysC
MKDDAGRVPHSIDREAGAFVVWFTGISGAGKSTIATALEEALRARSVALHNLDGDQIRRGLNRDLGYDDEARVESIRRISEVTRILVGAGMNVIVAAISPFREGRDYARSLIAPGRFIEVHVDTPLEVAESRDTKGLYRMAREGRLAHFTGIDSPYEEPLSPEVRIDSTRLSPEQAVNEIEHVMAQMGLITG